MSGCGESLSWGRIGLRSQSLPESDGSDDLGQDQSAVCALMPGSLGSVPLLACPAEDEQSGSSASVVVRWGDAQYRAVATGSGTKELCDNN